jgi:iron complex outermembrane recepter protein
MNWFSLPLHLCFLLLCCALPVRTNADVYDLVELSLEELMNVEISLVSRKAEPLFSAPAATFVLTGEDIKRSGATSIPEALRLVPGLAVARLDANKWAITARGFNGRFANKLLVQIDGRSVYTPLFSGVFWEVQDVLLEDVERIEVIRGPGATLWGANAVNGIINVVTKSSAATQGILVQTGAGSFERGFVQLRHGGHLGEKADYRLYGRTFARSAFADSSGRDSNDDWHTLHGGGRIDWSPTPRDDLSLQGQLYTSDIGQRYDLAGFEPPYFRYIDDRTDYSGRHALGRWQRRISDAADLSLQLYYDHTHWSDTLFVEKRDTYDIDFQHRVAHGRQEFVWGLGYRHSGDESGTTPFFSLSPTRRSDMTYSSFAQYELSLRDEQLRLVFGSKFEHNDYTGFEVQPSARMAWTPSQRQALWVAAARAVRTSSRADSDVFLKQQALPPNSLGPGSPLAVLAVVGNPMLGAEELLAYELGYRLRPNDALSLDLALYFNDYEQLRGGAPLLPIPSTEPGPPHLIIPYSALNNMGAHNRGFEAVAEWRDLDERWRWRAIYSYLDMHIELGKGLPIEAKNLKNETPQHQLSLWHSHNLRRGIAFDSIVRYVSALTFEHPDRRYKIDAYIELDTRLAWQVSNSVEIAAVGRNLFGGHPPEFRALFVQNAFTDTPRSAYLMLSYRR